MASGETNVGACPARPNGLCKDDEMFGTVSVADGLSCVGRTSSQRYDGRAGSPLQCIR